MRTIGVIPARYKSSRFLGKPLAKILGKPMIWWVYNSAMMVEGFYEVVVATDSKKIYDYCKNNSINVVMTGKNATGTDRVAEVSNYIKGDYYVNIQGDEPTLVSKVIEMVIDYDGCTTCLMAGATDNDLSSDIPKVVFNANNKAIYFSRFPIPAIKEDFVKKMKQVCVYGFTKDTLSTFSKMKRGVLEKSEGIELLRLVENNLNIKMIEIDYHHGHAVDYKSDIIKVEKDIISRYDSIVFDFDGVIVDSMGIKREAFYKLFPKKIRKKVDINEGGRSRYEKIPYFYKKFLGVQLTDKQIRKLSDTYSDLVFHEIINLVPNNDIIDILKNNCIDYYIVSGTPTIELIDILTQLGIINYFRGVYGGESEKNTILKTLSKRYDKIIYVGDQKKDMIESKKAGVKFFGYGSYFGSEDIQRVWLQ